MTSSQNLEIIHAPIAPPYSASASAQIAVCLNCIVKILPSFCKITMNFHHSSSQPWRYRRQGFYLKHFKWQFESSAQISLQHMFTYLKRPPDRVTPGGGVLVEQNSCLSPLLGHFSSFCISNQIYPSNAPPIDPFSLAINLTISNINRPLALPSLRLFLFVSFNCHCIN